MKKNMFLDEIREASAPHVFRALHAELNINWEEPVTVVKINGNYTALKVEKAATAAGYDTHKDIVALLTRDTANRYNHDFKLVTIEGSLINIEHNRCGSGSIYTNAGEYKSAPFTHYYTKGDFNEERKQTTTETYIIMQKPGNLSTSGENKKSFSNSERYTVIEARKHGDGRGNTYIGALELKRTTDNGSRARYEANPGRYINIAKMWKPATAAAAEA